MSSDSLIELKGVWKKYNYRETFHRSIREDIFNIFKRTRREDLKDGEFWALSDVNLRLSGGECIGFYGPNGAGKSTILKLIASVTYPTIGEVIIRGVVAPLIELGAGFHLDLTGRENIYINGAIIGMTIREIRENIDSIIEFSELSDFIDMPIKKYSSGMHLRLGFSIAVHSSAEIFLFDEILTVGDEYFQLKCLERAKWLKNNGRGIIIVSHDKKLLNEMSGTIYHINKGIVSTEDVKASGDAARNI
ncbi:MAG: ABC transporter ATP-binding protein [Nitrospirae bacterium]|nr:ABC transporter ATP-binding protein [Nitrospirota bacterium]MBF0534901.1 ABC transporter ATP-binding protein [Nitrospirota bacterium]MBF0616816.1 ABC transporter ATP-binding protein [Nitrospirota bacterium]